MSIIPAYSNPCLVLSPAKPSTAATLYLIGTNANFRLEIYVVNLNEPNDSAPQLLGVDTDAEGLWFDDSPKMCSNYAGSTSGTVSLSVHIQQFRKAKTVDKNIFPNGNTGFAGPIFARPKGGYGQISLLSPKLFAIVGQAGNTMYGVGNTDTPNPQDLTTWSGIAVDGTVDVGSSFEYISANPPSGNTSLIVGTFDTKSAPPVNGHIVAFNADRKSGLIYPTVGLSNQSVIRFNVAVPRLIKMNITLSPFAIPVHMGITAYILDMAKDGTVIIYTITPGTSEELKRVLTPSSAPRFNASMVATASESQIIVYSLLQSSPRFNIFNLTANEWTGPDLINQLPIVPEPGDGSGGNGSGGNGTDSGNSSSGTSNTAIIGGAVAGVLVLVLIAAFFIVRRKRQRSGRGRVSQKHSSAGRQGGGGSEGSSNLGAEEIEENKPVLSDYQQQQNRASLQMAESSRGSIMTLNSSSTAPLVYAPHRSSTGPGVQFAGHSQPGQLTSAPLTVPQQLQLQQQQIQQQQQQQQQQSRRGVSSQGMELLSLPVILEQHSFEQHSEGDDEEQLRKLEQESPFVARPYSNVTSFSYPTVYQDQPRHQHQPVRTTVINPYSGASVVDDEEQEPYVLPDPIIVAPTPVPHKAELLE